MSHQYLLSGRIGQDQTTETLHSMLNKSYSDYHLENYLVPTENNSFLNHVNLQKKGSLQVGHLGSNVDSYSELIKSSNTTNNVKINLQQRSYLSVPYLGKGNNDISIENHLLHGETFREKKSKLKNTEIPYFNVRDFPVHDKEMTAIKGSPECTWYLGENTRQLYREQKNN